MQYYYDAQNRVTQITNIDSTFPETITYMGADTVIFHDVEYQDAKNITSERTFSSFGDHLGSNIYFIGQNGDTSRVQNNIYHYDASHQVQQSVFYSTDYFGSDSIRALGDSSNYSWVNGNLSQKLGNTAELTFTYEYIPNSNGYFLFNTPFYSSNYILNTLSKGKLSANLVSKSIDGNGTVTNYTYTFDGSGRVKTVSHSGHTYTFHWKCI